jgi:hypothetical protein
MILPFQQILLGALHIVERQARDGLIFHRGVTNRGDEGGALKNIAWMIFTAMEEAMKMPFADLQNYGNRKLQTCGVRRHFRRTPI